MVKTLNLTDSIPLPCNAQTSSESAAACAAMPALPGRRRPGAGSIF